MQRFTHLKIPVKQTKWKPKILQKNAFKAWKIGEMKNKPKYRRVEHLEIRSWEGGHLKILERVMLSVNSRTVEMMDAITCSRFHCMLAWDKKNIRKRNSNAPQTMSRRQEVTRTQRHWRDMNRAFVSLVCPHNEYVEKRDYNLGKNRSLSYKCKLTSIPNGIFC